MEKKVNGSVNMAFVGVEFDEGNENTIALIAKAWLTPKKKETFWPPYKCQNKYLKALKCTEIPDEETWECYKIKKCYFETDDFNKATIKLKRLEETSDVGTDTETLKRKRLPPQRYSPDSSNDETSGHENEGTQNTRKRQLPRPPHLNISEFSEQNINEDDVPEVRDHSEIKKRNSIPYTSSPTTSTCTTLTLQQSFESSNKSTSDVGSQSQIIKFLALIKEQNNEILNLLKNKLKTPTTSRSILSENLPVKLPIESENSLNILEKFLHDKENFNAMCSYLSLLGGKDLNSQTNAILRFLITDNFASGFSFKGSRNAKKSFANLRLNELIIGAVKLTITDATNRMIEDSIKVWLKHAPGRLKLLNKK